MRRMLSITLSLIVSVALLLAPMVSAQQSSPGAAVTQTGSTGLAATQCIQSTADPVDW